MTTAQVPAGPWSLSVLEEAGALLLVDGGLRPGAALWMLEGMPLNRGFCKQVMGCLDPKNQHRTIKPSSKIIKHEIYAIVWSQCNKSILKNKIHTTNLLLYGASCRRMFLWSSIHKKRMLSAQEVTARVQLPGVTQSSSVNRQCYWHCLHSGNKNQLASKQKQNVPLVHQM